MMEWAIKYLTFWERFWFFKMLANNLSCKNPNSALYRLAQNKGCQTKLRQEIAECGQDLSFDVLSNLKYLDQVFNGNG